MEKVLIKYKNTHKIFDTQEWNLLKAAIPDELVNFEEIEEDQHLLQRYVKILPSLKHDIEALPNRNFPDIVEFLRDKMGTESDEMESLFRYYGFPIWKGL